MKVGFLFDNDGVLIDSSKIHWKSWQRLMEEEPSFKMSFEQFVENFGKRNETILKSVNPEGTKEEHERLAKRKEEIFRELAKDSIQLIDGMEEFLKVLKKRNISRIIASSTPKENLELFIAKTPLKLYFDHFISGEEVPLGKPAPDVFLEAAKKIGFKASDCIVLEDAPAGIMAGVAAGSFVVALATTHKQEQLKGYDLIYQSAKDLNLDEILKSFQEWRKRTNPLWKKTVGYSCLTLGALLILTPLPGFFLILVGLAFLNNQQLIKKLESFYLFFKKK